MTIFKCKNEFPEQLGIRKQMKKWGHLSGFDVFVLTYGPKIVRNCEKSKAVIEIYVCASESSRLTLLENGIGYYAMT